MRSDTCRCRPRGLFALVTVIVVQATQAQTRFTWPTREPAYTEYNVEQCWAAVERVRRHATWDARPDTLDPASLLLAPEHPSVVESARRCAANRALAGLPSVSQPTLLRLWAVAGEDSLYLHALRERLAGAGSPGERAGLLKDEIVRLLDMRPTRAALADTLTTELDRLGAPGSEASFVAHVRRVTVARDEGDFTRAAREVQKALDAESTLRKFDSTWVRRDPSARGLVAVTETWLLHLVPRDTLLQRDGPEAFLGAWRRDAAVRARTWQLSRGDSASLVSDAMREGGRTAPPLEADFWFNRSDSTVHRSVKGKMSLVVFVDERCRAQCYTVYSALQRLKRRFGAGLDVVLVTSTKGHYRQHPPLEPPAEAEVLRKYFLEYLALPATLAVVKAPFSTLPAPDRRRLYDRPPLFAAYSGVTSDVTTDESVQGHPAAFLIAPDGLILGRRDLQQDEVEVTHLIADLLAYYREHS